MCILIIFSVTVIRGCSMDGLFDWWFEVVRDEKISDQGKIELMNDFLKKAQSWPSDGDNKITPQPRRCDELSEDNGPFDR